MPPKKRNDTGGKDDTAARQQNSPRRVTNVQQYIHSENTQIGNENTMSVTAVGEDLPEPVGDDDERQTYSACGTTSHKSYAQAVAQTTQAPTNFTQNIQTKFANITNIFPATSDEACSEPISPSHKKIVGDILSAVDYFNVNSHYLLIIGHIENKQNIESLSLVPWTAVFDFDQNSRTTGILSVVENSIRMRRSLHIDSWQDKITINSNSTRWIFMRGSRETPDTLIDGDFSEWSKRTKMNLDSSIVQQLSEYGEKYTNYTAIVIWPSTTNKSDYRCFHKLLTDLESGISSNVSVVIVQDPDSKTAIGDHYLQTIQLDQEEKCKHFTIPLSLVCSTIDTCLSDDFRTIPTSLKLPILGADSKMTTDDVAYLKEDLEVLYCHDPKHEDESIDIDATKLKVECDNFYRGGTLPWNMWHLIGAGFLDAERDIMTGIVRNIKSDNIRRFKSGRITLYHAPGSGGTTLSHRILWELRQTVPCAEVKLRTGSTIHDLADKVELLYDKTHMPILLLMDGEEEPRVAQLEQALRDICVIILHVRRYPYPITDTKRTDNGREYWLQDHVSKKEAICLALKFANQNLEDKTNDAIGKLQRDVLNGKRRSIFDFGITAYNYKYKGICSYVNGFLDLDNNEDNKIQPSQEALGILALVYYYGQSGLPCHFFAKVFDRQNKGMAIDNFPDIMKGLIVPDRSEEKCNIVRISHYLVAKEILDQILPFPSKRRDQPGEFLSKEAKSKIADLAISFITQAGDGSHTSANVLKIMTKTFITRDNKPAGENETIPKLSKKPKLAPILEDASQTPPYTPRFKILEQLTNSFPMEPQYCAHMGRLYTICREQDDVNAKKWFSKAEKLCNNLVSGKGIADMTHNMRLTLMHVYHMYAIMYLRMIAKYTGNSFDDKPTLPTESDEFNPTAERLLALVETAGNYFTKCREVTPRGCEKSYYFIGEIQVRLMFCEFIHKYGTSQEEDLYDFMEHVDNKGSKVSDFLETSLIQIDDLFLDCFSVVDQDTMDYTIENCQVWFMALFKRKPRHVLFKMDTDSIHSRRLAITETKLKYDRDNKIGFLEYIDKREDITFIVKQHEAIFGNVVNSDQAYSNKRTLDLGYREWIYAIRHKCYEENYPVETVLEMVRQWFDLIHTPQSRFYVFILESMLGLGTSGVSGNTELLIEAQRSKTELLKQSAYIIRPRYPQEWLGTGDGIKRLHAWYRFFGQIDHRQIPPLFRKNLEIMKGTICKPNMKAASGFIDLDDGGKNLVSVKVFYVPAVSDTKGQSFAGRRVEFALAFSISHGYEAYNVRLLTTIKCPECRVVVEVHTGDRKIYCPKCKQEIRKSAIQK